MSSFARNLRKARREAVREAGRAAYFAGRHIQTNPYPTHDCNRYQWAVGYNSAVADDETEEFLHG